MSPRLFLRILQVRWQIVLLLVLLGSGAGWLTTPDARAVPTDEVQEELTLWQATNVQFLQSTTPGGLTPEQVEFFAQFDELSSQVAEVAEVPEEEVSGVSLDFDTTLGLLRITATNVDRERAVLLANTYAEELDSYLAARSKAEQVSRRDNVLAQIETLEQRVRELDGEIAAADGTGKEILETERDSVLGQLRVAQEQLQQLAFEDDAGSGLTLAQRAEAVVTDGPAYYAQVLASTGAEDLADQPDDPTERSQPPDDDAAADTDSARQQSDTDSAQQQSDTVTGEDLPDDFPVQPQPKRAGGSGGTNSIARAGVGGFAGLVTGLAVIALLAMFDNRIRSRADAEAAFGLPVLAQVPMVRRRDHRPLHALTEPRGEVADAFRSVRSSLFLPRDVKAESGKAVSGLPAGTAVRDLRVVMVSSPRPADGKSTTVANLAVCLAAMELRVLVVDGDVHRPGSSGLLETQHGPAFGDRDATEIEADVEMFCAPTVAEGVSVARAATESSGVPACPDAAIRAQRALVRAARRHFDVILLDTAPILSKNDAADLLIVTDAVLFVARSGSTRIPEAEAAVERFEQLRAPMAGVVLLAAHSRRGRRSHTSPASEPPAGQSSTAVPAGATSGPPAER